MIFDTPCDRPSYELRAQTPAEMEHDWLEGVVRKQLNNLYGELTRGYPRLDVPDNIDAALSRLEDVADLITRRQNELDGGE